jgi:citrate synthase
MKKTILDSFFDNFAGQEIMIMTKHVMEQMTQTEDSIETIKAPISFQGYLTDEDDVYYYLGYDPDQIHQCVKKDQVVQIALYVEEPEQKEIPNVKTKPSGLN